MPLGKRPRFVEIASVNAQTLPGSVYPQTIGDDEAFSLPAWIYRDPAFFELEKQHIFRTSWHLVCHQNDIPATGDYHTFEILGDSVMSVRGDDRRIRSFHNVCRHRASRLLDGAKGQCGRRITCPY